MEYKTFDEIINALKSGKKITSKHGKNYRLTKGSIGNETEKWLKIKYYWCNPQMNRTFAMLEDGTYVDSSISIIDLLYTTFIDYIEETPTIRKMTLEEIEKELGYKIEITH